VYEAHFGVRDKPFTVTPDPQVFYQNAAYREALATLVYAVQERRGFGLLTGEVGTGKTTVVRRALEELGPAVRGLHFYHTMLGFEDLVRVMCDEFRVPGADGPLVTQLTRLNDWLIGELEAGRIVALLLDEAQNLADDTLESLRLLSNLETDRAKLLQIVLIGQPELEAKLARPHLRQIRQRVAVRCRLGPLVGAEEVRRFIEYRLARAGHTGRELFTPDAVTVVAAASRGVPRLVNILGDNALLLAYAAGARRVTAGVAREAAVDLGLLTAGGPRRGQIPGAGRAGVATPRRAPWWPSLAVAVGLAGALAVSAMLWSAGGRPAWSTLADAARARLSRLSAYPAAAPPVAAEATPEPAAPSAMVRTPPPATTAPPAARTGATVNMAHPAPPTVTRPAAPTSDDDDGPLALMESLLERIRAHPRTSRSAARPSQE
jgi:general secretion pathway protein A